MTRKEINKLKAEKVKTSFCIACNKTYPKEKFQISPCRKSKNGLKSWCNWCLRNRPHSKGLKNGRKRSIEYFAKKRAKANERTVKRRTSARNYVMPKWANKEKIKEIYKQANKMTLETGILYQVDHIIPLNSKLVCGLHVETNLQILTKSENCKKGNRFKPFFY